MFYLFIFSETRQSYKWVDLFRKILGILFRIIVAIVFNILNIVSIHFNHVVSIPVIITLLF